MFRVLSPTTVCLILTLSGFQAVPMSALREAPETTIAEGIRVLEAKAYRTFLLEFVPPGDVATRFGSPDALAAAVEVFTPRAEVLLAALKEVRAQTPTYDAGRTIATFELKGNAGPRTMRFVKVGKYWYFADK